MGQWGQWVSHCPTVGDVGEEQGDLAALWPAKAESIDLEPPRHRGRPLDKAQRFAGKGHVAIDLKPVRFEIGH